MKPHFLNRLLPLISIGLISMSCQEYLALKPSSNVAIPSNLEDVELLLNNSQFLNFTSAGLGNGSTDDFFLSLEVYESSSKTEQDAYRWEWQDDNFSNEWSRTYRAINITNIGLETLGKIERIDANAQKWDHLKGTALVYRAFHFLNAVWTFSPAYDATTSNSDVGIVLRTSSDINVKSKRSSVRECYEKIIADLKMAVPLIRTTSQLPTLPTRATAYSLLARTYLSMRLYNEALHYSDSCLSIVNGLLDFSSDISIPGGSGTPFDRFNKEVVFSAHAFPSFSSGRPSSASVDTNLMELYHVHDLRRQAFFWARNNGTIQFRGVYSPRATTLFSGITTAEMILVRAECLVRAGKLGEALTDLNMLLLSRWDVNYPFEPLESSDQATVLKWTLSERRKELIGRNLRHIDLKRLNKEGYGIKLVRRIKEDFVELSPDDPRWNFPLPNDIVVQTGMPQNQY